MKDKLCVIEQSNPDYYGSCQYRFVSLYNGARGTWSYGKQNAIKEGEAHSKIIKSLAERAIK